MVTVQCPVHKTLTCNRKKKPTHCHWLPKQTMRALQHCHNKDAWSVLHLDEQKSGYNLCCPPTWETLCKLSCICYMHVRPKPPPLSVVVRVEAHGSHILERILDGVTPTLFVTPHVFPHNTLFIYLFILSRGPKSVHKHSYSPQSNIRELISPNPLHNSYPTRVIKSHMSWL